MNTQVFNKNFSKILIGFTVAALQTGCLNNHTAPATTSTLKSFATASSSSTTSTDLNSDYICTGKTNIHPKYDFNFNGTYEFEVCTHKSINAKILIKAPGMEDQDLCVLPAQYYTETKIVMKPGADLLPIYDHGIPGEHGLRLEFKNTNFNAVVVVSCTSIAEMRSCLYANYLDGCPRDWSYGKFRD